MKGYIVPIIIIMAHLCLFVSSCDDEFVDDGNLTSSQFPYKIGVVDRKSGLKLTAIERLSQYFYSPDRYDVCYDNRGNLTHVEHKGKASIDFTNMNEIVIKNDYDPDTVYVTYNKKGYATLLKCTKYFNNGDKSNQISRVAYVQIEYDDDGHIEALTEMPFGGEYLLQYRNIWDNDKITSIISTGPYYDIISNCIYDGDVIDNRYQQNVVAPSFFETLHPRLSSIMAYLGLLGKGPRQLPQKLVSEKTNKSGFKWEETFEYNYVLNDNGTIGAVGRTALLYE